jgi:hypothetical protein
MARFVRASASSLMKFDFPPHAINVINLGDDEASLAGHGGKTCCAETYFSQCIADNKPMRFAHA